MPIYFVTACTHERQKILADPQLHERLIQFAENGPERGVWRGAYVLMPDHLHAFVALDQDGDDHGPRDEVDGHRPPLQLGDWMKSLKNALSKVLHLFLEIPVVEDHARRAHASNGKRISVR
ncbi:MAG: hypothetical protein ACR2OZ_15815 [Verrucomicrobiales bacterium]